MVIVISDIGAAVLVFLQNTSVGESFAAPMAPVGTFTCENTTPVTVQRQYHQSKSCCIQQTSVRGQKNFHAQVWLKVNINLVSVGFSLNLDMQGAEATECESHGYLMLEMLTHRPTGRPRYYMYAVCSSTSGGPSYYLYVVCSSASG